MVQEKQQERPGHRIRNFFKNVIPKKKEKKPTQPPAHSFRNARSSQGNGRTQQQPFRGRAQRQERQPDARQRTPQPAVPVNRSPRFDQPMTQRNPNVRENFQPANYRSFRGEGRVDTIPGERRGDLSESNRGEETWEQLEEGPAMEPAAMNAPMRVVNRHVAREASPEVQLNEAGNPPARELVAALTDLEDTHARHYHLLNGLLEDLPESARPRIRQAMVEAQRAWQNARDNRRRWDEWHGSRNATEHRRNEQAAAPRGGNQRHIEWEVIDHRTYPNVDQVQQTQYQQSQTPMRNQYYGNHPNDARMRTGLDQPERQARRMNPYSEANPARQPTRQPTVIQAPARRAEANRRNIDSNETAPRSARQQAPSRPQMVPNSSGSSSRVPR